MKSPPTLSNTLPLVTLVINGTVLYPLSEVDAEHLQRAGSPLRYINSDYLPVLLRFTQEKLQFKVQSFDELEQQLVVKFRKRWPHEATWTSKQIVLSYPKHTDQALVDKAHEGLKRWYLGHYTDLEPTIKRAGKMARMILQKRRPE